MQSSRPPKGTMQAVSGIEDSSWFVEECSNKQLVGQVAQVQEETPVVTPVKTVEQAVVESLESAPSTSEFLNFEAVFEVEEVEEPESKRAKI
jgi:hypothetical protein